MAHAVVVALYQLTHRHVSISTSSRFFTTQNPNIKESKLTFQPLFLSLSLSLSFLSRVACWSAFHWRFWFRKLSLYKVGLVLYVGFLMLLGKDCVLVLGFLCFPGFELWWVSFVFVEFLFVWHVVTLWILILRLCWENLSVETSRAWKIYTGLEWYSCFGHYFSPVVTRLTWGIENKIKCYPRFHVSLSEVETLRYRLFNFSLRFLKFS